MKKALIIIDIQNDYFKGGQMPVVNAEKAAANAKIVLDYFRQKGDVVVHIQHVSTRAGATFFLKDSPGVAIHNIVQPVENEVVIEKHYPNAFRETELLSYLKQKNISDLVVCGMMTHVCVDATTRAAKDLGFNIELIGDACATRDLEVNGAKVKAGDVQNAFLAALNYYYSDVVDVEAFLK